jgi:hypothetical protein
MTTEIGCRARHLHRSPFRRRQRRVPLDDVAGLLDALDAARPPIVIGDARRAARRESSAGRARQLLLPGSLHRVSYVLCPFGDSGIMSPCLTRTFSSQWAQ